MQDAQPTSAQSTLLGPDDPAPFSRLSSRRTRGTGDVLRSCRTRLSQVPRNAGARTARARPAHRLGHRHRGTGPAPGAVARRAVLHDRLFAAGDRLQPAPRRSDLDRRRRAIASRARQSRPVSAADRRRRQERSSGPITRPVAEIEGRVAARRIPVVISLHSFTPIMNGFQRPWHVGVLWNRDPRMPVPLMRRLARGAGPGGRRQRALFRAATATAIRSRRMPRRWAWRMRCSRSART